MRAELKEYWPTPIWFYVIAEKAYEYLASC